MSGQTILVTFPWYFRICVIEAFKQFPMRSLMLVMNEWVSCDKTMFCCHSKVADHIFSTELFVPTKLWSSSAHDWCRIVQIWLGLVCRTVQIWSWLVCRLNPTEMKVGYVALLFSIMFFLYLKHYGIIVVQIWLCKFADLQNRDNSSLGFYLRAKKGAILQMWPQFESTYFQPESLEEF
jgi:hypothetical protein